MAKPASPLSNDEIKTVSSGRFVPSETKTKETKRGDSFHFSASCLLTSISRREEINKSATPLRNRAIIWVNCIISDFKYIIQEYEQSKQ